MYSLKEEGIRAFSHLQDTPLCGISHNKNVDGGFHAGDAPHSD
jgi:hypothetical protein